MKHKSPTSPTFYNLIFGSAILNDEAADLASVGLSDGSIVQLVAGQLEANVEGHCEDEVRLDGGGRFNCRVHLRASVTPCDEEEFHALHLRASEHDFHQLEFHQRRIQAFTHPPEHSHQVDVIDNFTAAEILAIITEEYTIESWLERLPSLDFRDASLLHRGRLCGTEDVANEEAILSLIKSAGTVSGFLAETSWTNYCEVPDEGWQRTRASVQTYAFLLKGHLLTLRIELTTLDIGY